MLSTWRMSLVHLLFGRRLATEEDEGERVGPIAGVPILGLDALASASYGPEALLTVLIGLGTLATQYVPWITLLIVGLLGILYVSYRQTIAAYPSGGGAYSVAKENMGTNASLLAAAALAIDYVLNVAVAVSAGIGALVSAVPTLLSYTVELCLGVVALLTIVNLRGVRASGAAFAIPTYVFVASLFAVIAIGVARTVASGGAPVPVDPPHLATPHATTSLVSLWLLVHAFSSGCTAMTGVEAVSNGVPIFHPPAWVGARRTLTLIVGILVVLLLGVAFLSRAYGITATPPGTAQYESVLSQMVAAVVGRGPFYYVAIGSVVAVLCLSANTSFADFPRLCRIIAVDRFLPEMFVHRGRRLAYSFGILALATTSAVLLVVFEGITDHLIPLFAIGAFLAFTTSQAAMVAHWWRVRGPSWWRHLAVNALGAVATATTLIVIAISKLEDGAWISVVLVAGSILLFKRVRAHYDFVAHATAARDVTLDFRKSEPPIVVVPMLRWDAVTVKALRFAIGFSPEVMAVQVLTGDRDADDLTSRWRHLVVEPADRLGVPAPRLVVIHSRYRELLRTLVRFVRHVSSRHPDREIAVVVPQLVEPRWYQWLLHTPIASLLKTALLLRGGPQIVVINTPWYLDAWIPEQRRLAAPPMRGGLGDAAPT
ncbi:Amino acid permease [Sandaracinus amylolyticus]|uniref:Amino acid permease n=2 Tax=Sandaracinus amylolyticus TaxID=927083 RepID=A0A0F6W526_9BACT|nr:Amino acid permease [Sandaracinus amylolyticus]